MAVLLVLLLGAFSLAKSITSRQREQATLALKKPEALEHYEQLSLPKQSRSPERKTPQVQPQALENEHPDEKLAAWGHLLTRWERFMANKSDDGWHGVLVTLGIDNEHGTVEKGKSPKQLSPEEWTRIETCLSREQDLVREILEVAPLGGPVCAFDFTCWPFPAVTHHLPLFQMCAFLVWDANVKIRAGEKEAAINNLLGGMQLGNALIEEPLLFSQYGRMAAIYRQVGWGLREGFEPGQIPSGLLQQVLNELGGADMHKAFADGLRSECFIRLRANAAQAGAGQKARGVVDMDRGAPARLKTLTGSWLLRAYASPLGAPWFDADQAVFAAAIERLATAAEQPYYRAKPVLTSIQEDYSAGSLAHPYLNVMLAGSDGCLELQAQCEVALNLTRIGLLIEHHRAHRSEYPQTLDEFAPDFGGTVPLDPFSGQPYRYVLGDDSFVLYSVGPNLRDDGGKPDWRDGDLPWRHN
jgi:hypothetical protein